MRQRFMVLSSTTFPSTIRLPSSNRGVVVKIHPHPSLSSNTAVRRAPRHMAEPSSDREPANNWTRDGAVRIDLVITRSLHDVPDRADIGLIADPRSRRSRAPGILVGLHLNSKTGRRIIDQPIKQTQTRELKLRRKEGPVNAQDWSSDVNIFSNPSHVTTRESPSSRNACATISGGHSAMRCAKPSRSPANRAREASSKPGKSPAMACRKR